MARSDVLVDSNVYIHLLRSKADVVDVLYQLKDTYDLTVCGMIRMEVLRGVTSHRVRERLSQFMDVMINVPSSDSLWRQATELAWNLDRQGIVIPGPDLVIAACAIEADAAVMTSDAHFSKIEGLRVIAPPPEWFQ